MLIEALKPLTVRCSSGDLRLTPGCPVDFPDEEAGRLLAKACGKVRAVGSDLDAMMDPVARMASDAEIARQLGPGWTWKTTAIYPAHSPVPALLTPNETVVIEPAATTDRLIYWETGNGQILGPAVPEFLMRDRSSFWISTTFEQTIWWINADRLRSRKAYLEQRQVREVELIRSF